MRFRIYTEPQQGASYEQLTAIATTAAECGFEGFLRSDHLRRLGEFKGTGEDSGFPGPTDAWISLAGLARDTSKIRLGVLATPITHDYPALLALRVAQVDAMSGGRVELGIGAGWDDIEHAYFGIPFPPLVERFDRLEETLSIITGLWTTPVGQRYSFVGKYYSVHDNPGLPKPIQSPHPPVIVGGVGKHRTPRLAARFGSEYNLTIGNPGMMPQDIRGQFARVREACEAVGRDPSDLRMSAQVIVCCGRSTAEVNRRWERLGLVADGLIAGCASGTPDEVVDRIYQYQRDGAETVNLNILDLDDLDHIRLLAEDVVPQLAAR